LTNHEFNICTSSPFKAPLSRAFEEEVGCSERRRLTSHRNETYGPGLDNPLVLERYKSVGTEVKLKIKRPGFKDLFLTLR
jgi:hypothetical protein